MYQILFFLPPLQNRCPLLHQLIKQGIRSHFCSGGPLSQNIVALFEDENWDNFDSAYPAIAFYFRGSKRIPEEVEVRIQELIKADVMFIPCFRENFKMEVPDLLAPFQGLSYGANVVSFLEEAKNAALSYFNLLGKPKVFISYSQREKSTRQFAHELFDALSRKHYTPFLDTRVIQAPSIFQATLEEELLDGDIVILLDSEKSLTSKWCKHEVKLATNASMGLIRVEWPDVDKHRNYQLLENIKLTTNDLNDHTKRHEVIEHILQLTDRMRARAREARLKKLYEKIHRATRLNLIPTHHMGCYHYMAEESGRPRYFVPIVGIPRSQDFHRAYESIPSNIPFELSYIPTPTETPTKSHLQWLSNQLSITLTPY